MPRPQLPALESLKRAKKKCEPARCTTCFVCIRDIDAIHIHEHLGQPPTLGATANCFATHGPTLRFRCGEEGENLNSTTDLDMDLSSGVVNGNVAAEMVDTTSKKTLSSL